MFVISIHQKRQEITFPLRRLTVRQALMYEIGSEHLNRLVFLVRLRQLLFEPPLENPENPDNTHGASHAYEKHFVQLKKSTMSKIESNRDV
jgi:hypothetical protein